MKWIIVVVATLAVLGAAIAGIGAMLPVAHTARVRIQLNQPVDDVWQTIATLGDWPGWNSAVTSMERVEDQAGRQVWVLVDQNGRMSSEVLESTLPSNGKPGKLVTQIADPDLPYGGKWTWLITPTEDGCSVSITEDGEIYNVAFRFLARFVFGYTANAESYLKALGESFGETVTPVTEVN